MFRLPASVLKVSKCTVKHAEWLAAAQFRGRRRTFALPSLGVTKEEEGTEERAGRTGGAIYCGRRGARNHRVIDSREVRRDENRPLVVEIESDSRTGKIERSQPAASRRGEERREERTNPPERSWMSLSTLSFSLPLRALFLFPYLPRVLAVAILCTGRRLRGNSFPFYVRQWNIGRSFVRDSPPRCSYSPLRLPFHSLNSQFVDRIF